MTGARKTRLLSRVLLGAGLAVAGMLACTSTNGSLLDILQGGFLNLTQKRTGNVLIGFVNNTNARAIFTFGGWEPLDETTAPTFGQLELEAGTSSQQIAQLCRRSFAIGSADLIRLVKASGQAVSIDKALVTGVNFSSAPLTDPLGTEPTDGTAAPFQIFQGNDYQCAGLLLFSFEQDAAAAGGFRIDYRFLPQK